MPVEPPSSSQDLLLQGDQPVAQSPHLAKTTHTQASVPQPPIKPSHSSSWPDEVAEAEQSGRSTSETVVPNWAYSGRVRGPRPRSQPLVYPTPAMPTPITQCPSVPPLGFGPTIPSLQPQPTIPQPPPYDRPTSTDNISVHGPFPKKTPQSYGA